MRDFTQNVFLELVIYFARGLEARATGHATICIASAIAQTIAHALRAMVDAVAGAMYGDASCCMHAFRMQWHATARAK